MNIAGTALDRFGEDHIHQLDDWRLVSRSFQILQVHLGFSFLDFEIAFGTVQRGHDRFEIVLLLGAVGPFDAFLNLALGGNHRLDVVAGHELDIVEREYVCGIDQGEGQGGPNPAQWQYLVALGDFVGNQFDDGGIDFAIGKIDRRYSILAGNKSCNLGFVEKTQFDQRRAKPPAFLPLQLLSLLQLLWSDRTFFD